MTKIDISKWKPFAIEKLFTVVKGTRLTKANMRDGDVRFIGASAINNGVTSHIANKEKLHPANTITITYNGSVGEAFYQDKEFWASDDVNVLYSKFEMNRYTALFIIPLLKSAGRKYAFIDKWKKETMEKDSIMLPVDQTGNPDFAYMESYMRNLESAVSSSLTALQSAKSSEICKSIDVSTWREFAIGELFEIKRPTARSQSNYEEGNVPFVASGNFNNGVLKYLSPKDNEQLDKGNCITVSPIDGSSFYQKSDFLGRGGAGSSVLLLYNDMINEKSGMFIATIIRTVCQKYGYSNMGNKDTVAMERIKLPVSNDGKPDFSLMERYMDNIKNIAEQKLNNLVFA